MEEKKIKVIDLIEIYKSIIKHRKLFYKTLPIAFVASCLFILSVPRYYTCEVKLAPEIDGLSGGGTLSSLASSFGLDMMSSMTSSDAIVPELYPDLMNSIDFTISLFPMKVTTKEAHSHDHIQRLHKEPHKKPLVELHHPADKETVPRERHHQEQKRSGIDAFMLTKSQMGLVQTVQGNVGCNVDKKTQVITISVTDQDPLVCATMADSVRVKLQEFITDYRTNKAKNDLEFTKKLLHGGEERIRESPTGIRTVLRRKPRDGATDIHAEERRP